MSPSHQISPGEPRITLFVAMVALFTLGLFATTVLVARTTLRSTDTRTVTLTLPHGCEAPTQPGEQLTIRAHIKPGAVSFAECTKRPAQGAR